MKKSFFQVTVFILAMYLLPTQLLAQKFGYVDTNFILKKMPEYQEAKGEIDKLAKAWQDEIQNMQIEIDNMYSELKAEEVLLTVEMKEDRLKEIKEREVALKEYQKKVFGFEGLFFLKKKELIKPVQDKVFEAVEKVAHEHKLQVVFDKSGELVMIYTDPVHDYTDFVLEELGLGDPNDVINN
ncbi:MAG: OmpH family outer membrane protein [Cyclobacteriaceae bacterium]|nr:OmpH family outer membrane protein [Cyclobacteriaceae bacterium]